MNKVVKNYLYNLSYQILIIIVPLITTPYVSRVLGANGLGAFSYTNSIVQYFILFGCIGLNLYGQREIAYAQNDKSLRDKTFHEIVLLRIITVSLSLISYFIIFILNSEYSVIYMIMSLDIFASMFDISWFFQGIEDFKKIVIRNFILKFVGVALIFIFIKNSSDLYLYVFCHSITLFLGNLSMWLYIPKMVNKVRLKKLNILKHLRPTLALFIPQIAVSIYTVFDKTMIGLLTGNNEEVAFYEQSQKIIKIVLTLVTSLSTVMMPRIANLYHQNDFEQVKMYILKSIRFIFIIAFPMMFGLMGISKSIVPWFFGPGYDRVIPNMIIISPIIVCIAFSGLFGTQYLLAVHRQKEYTTSVMVGMATNFLLNLLLIPRLQSVGAAIATVISEFMVVVTQLIYLRNEFSLKGICQGNIKYISTSILMFIPIYYLSCTIQSNIINTLILVSIGVLIYFLTLILVFKDFELINLIGIILKKRK